MLLFQYISLFISSLHRSICSIDKNCKCYFHTSFLFLILCFSNSMLLAQNLGEINGRVWDQKTKTPIANASVVLKNSTQGTITDTDGYFVIKDIQPDTYTLSVSHLGYQMYSDFKLIVKSKGNVFLKIELDEVSTSLEEVVLLNTNTINSKETPLSIQTLSAVEIETYPGGNNDVIKSVQSLPGIAPIGSYRNELIIRGGAPNESVYYLDGMEVPNINHFMTQGSSGGTVGIVNVSFIKDMTLSRSAFGAEYDNPLSGVLAFQQKRGDARKASYNFRVGASEAGLTYNGPLFKKGEDYSKTTLIASVRHSYLQFVLESLGSPVRPQYWDYQWKLSHQVNDQNTLSFIGIGSKDDTRIVDTGTTATTEQEPIIKQNTHAIGLTWTHQYKNGDGNLKLTLSNNKLVNDFSIYEDNVNELNAVFKNDAIEGETKLRLHSTHYQGNWKFSLGTNIQASAYKNNSFSPLFKAFQYDTKINFTKYGFFVKTSGSVLNNRLDIALGIRMDDDTFSTGSNLGDTFSPRTSLSYALTQDFKWKLNASVGRYYKIPVYPLLGYQFDGNYVNKDAQYTQSDHIVVGIAYRPRPSTLLTLEAFSKAYSNYPISIADDISLANKGTDFEILGNEAVETKGKGKSAGVEFWFQQKLTNRLYATMTYSYFFSEFNNLNSETLFPSLWDSRYIFSFTGGYKMKRNWEFSIRYRQAGATPYPLADEEASLLAYPRLVYDYTTLRKNNLDGFREGNFRIDKRWNFKRFAFNFYFEVFNFLGQTVQLPDGYAIQKDADGEIKEPKELMRLRSEGISNPIPSVGLVFDF